MNRADFIDHVTSCSCTILRTDPRGYSIARNIINGKLSGIPGSDPAIPATICRICKTLDIAVPNGMHDTKNLIDVIEKNHKKK